MLIEAAEMLPIQIVEMLNNFGEHNIHSGCKNQLVMQLRDLLLEQCGQPGKKKVV